MIPEDVADRMPPAKEPPKDVDIGGPLSNQTARQRLVRHLGSSRFAREYYTNSPVNITRR
jgi:hypothetical protein